MEGRRDGRTCTHESLSTYVNLLFLFFNFLDTFLQNIRVISHYYARIRLLRLQTLLDLSIQQTEETLSRLVVSGSIWARIDRPAGIVNFREKRSAEDVMNEWSSDMSKLLGLVEKSWMGMNAALAAQARG